MRLTSFALLSLTLTSAAAVVIPKSKGGDMMLGEGVDDQPRGQSDAQVDRREAVKAAFLDTYKAYVEYASPSDVLNPISKTGSNTSTLAGWGGSIVNSLSTMIVMGLDTTDAYEKALAHTKDIDFTVASGGDRNSSLRIFVSTIRYIGGMLSAYQLMGEKQEHRFLVDQAKVLADRLSRGWYDGHRLPNNRLLYNQGIPEEVDDAVTIASAGTISLEWAVLSQYTGNDTYRKLTNDAVNAIIETNATLLPGLPTSWLGIANESARAVPYVTLGAGADSYFETLIKYGQLWGESVKDKRIAAWELAVNSSVQHLIVKSGVGNLTFLSDYTGGDNAYRFSHLASQAGGNWALGGRLIKRDDWVQKGLELTESIWRVGNSTATGLVPETLGYFDAEGNAKGWEVTELQRAFYNKHGYFMDDKSNAQRPEVIQNLFHAFRVTGDNRWRDMAWTSFLAMKKHYGTNSRAWAGIQDVDNASSEQIDETSASAFSELFKYLYLSEYAASTWRLPQCYSSQDRDTPTVFDDSSSYSLDDYIYTTEGHLFKVAKRNPEFGTIQGSFAYQPLSSTNDKPVPVNATTASA